MWQRSWFKGRHRANAVKRGGLYLTHNEWSLMLWDENPIHEERRVCLVLWSAISARNLTTQESIPCESCYSSRFVIDTLWIMLRCYDIDIRLTRGDALASCKCSETRRSRLATWQRSRFKSRHRAKTVMLEVLYPTHDEWSCDAIRLISDTLWAKYSPGAMP